MRSTRIVTIDRRMLAIHNRAIVNSTVASYTNFPNLRIDVPATIAVDESIDRVRGLALAVVADDSRFLSAPSAGRGQLSE
ncbi:MAG: small conductance mechanosensitive channel [Bradymonadia bacterium]|jgi:small conductance mechanosensitive channel